MQDLGVLQAGDFTSSALGVNNSGQVVGYSFSTFPKAFVWDSQGGMQDLNNLIPLNSWALEMATAINNKGQILCIGRNSFFPDHALLLTPTTSSTR